MKRPLCVLAGLLAATLLAGAASAADLISLRLGDVKGDRYAALRASRELDDLPYKLEMSAFPSGAPVLEALNAGALDIGFTGDIPFLFIYAAGAPLKAVGAWHFNPATVALVVGKDSPIDHGESRRSVVAGLQRGAEFAVGGQTGMRRLRQALEPEVAIRAVQAQAEVGVACQFAQQFRFAAAHLLFRAEAAQFVAKHRELGGHRQVVEFDEMLVDGPAEDQSGDRSRPA